MILSDDYEAIRDAVRSFAQAEVLPKSQESEAIGGYPSTLFAEPGKTGPTA